MRGPSLLRRGSASEIQPSRSGGGLKSRRTGKRSRPAQRERLRRQLGLEQLEDRRVMSVFYDLREISDPTPLAASRLPAIETDVSVNSRGQVAFVAELNGNGEAVMVGNGNSPSTNLSSLLGPLDDDYSSPQIADDGKVVVRSDSLAVGAVSVFDASAPVSFTSPGHGGGVPGESRHVYGGDARPALRRRQRGLRRQERRAGRAGTVLCQRLAAAARQRGPAARPAHPAPCPPTAGPPCSGSRQRRAEEIVVVRPSGNSFVTQVLASTNAADPAKLFQDLGPRRGSAATARSSSSRAIAARGRACSRWSTKAAASGRSSAWPARARWTTIRITRTTCRFPITNWATTTPATPSICRRSICTAASASNGMGLNGASFNGESFVVTFVGTPSAGERGQSGHRRQRRPCCSRTSWDLERAGRQPAGTPAARSTGVPSDQPDARGAVGRQDQRRRSDRLRTCTTRSPRRSTTPAGPPAPCRRRPLHRLLGRPARRSPRRQGLPRCAPGHGRRRTAGSLGASRAAASTSTRTAPSISI